MNYTTFGDPRPNRTVNLLLRRELLYPIELWDPGAACQIRTDDLLFTK